MKRVYLGMLAFWLSVLCAAAYAQQGFNVQGFNAVPYSGLGVTRRLNKNTNNRIDQLEQKIDDLEQKIVELNKRFEVLETKGTR